MGAQQGFQHHALGVPGGLPGESLMAVYVDNMRARYGRMILCHMIADTDQELRDMAARIGVQQRWHQGDHFDICLEKRALAIAAGALEITLRECAAMRIRRRRTGELGAPGDAMAWVMEAGVRATAAKDAVPQPLFSDQHGS